MENWTKFYQKISKNVIYEIWMEIKQAIMTSNFSRLVPQQNNILKKQV